MSNTVLDTADVTHDKKSVPDILISNAVLRWGYCNSAGRGGGFNSAVVALQRYCQRGLQQRCNCASLINIKGGFIGAAMALLAHLNISNPILLYRLDAWKSPLQQRWKANLNNWRPFAAPASTALRTLISTRS